MPAACFMDFKNKQKFGNNNSINDNNYQYSNHKLFKLLTLDKSLICGIRIIHMRSHGAILQPDWT